MDDTIDMGGVGNNHDATDWLVLPQEGVVMIEVERELLRQALERTTGNRTHAARLLGITRNQLRYRMRKFGLELAFVR